ncbi:hypothetical protein MZM54_04845 [[Brevibacterium] frigoritolerans]|nr:hypothetical protein [Peribacillus frigoritolerans]
MTTVVEKEVLTDTWKSILEPVFENIEIKIVSKDTNSKSYSFLVEFKSKLGKRKINWIYVKLNQENQLSISYSKLDAKETRRLLSGITDVILDHIEHLDPSFLLMKTFGTVKFPALYLNKEEREVKKTRPPGVKKADILAKKSKILAFFEELKTKKLPVCEPDKWNDERRVFQVGGTGSKYLAEVLLELGIVKDFRKWDKCYAVNFNHEHYASSYYSVLDEWEEFVKKEIGFSRCYIHIYYID